MATTLERPNPEAHADPRVLHPLRRLRGLIRTYVSIEGLLTVALFLTVWFWVGLLLDYVVFKVFTFDWVQEAPRGLRRGVLIAIVAALLAVVIVRIVLRLIKDFSHRSLALVLERRFPDLLGDRLITAVELADIKQQEQYGYSPDMIRKTIVDARDRVEQAPVNQVFNWRRLRSQGYIVLALTLGLFVLVWAVFSAAWNVHLKPYLANFSDVSSIWFERNVLLRNTTWPRKAYLEFVAFPESGELRVSRDQPPPKVRVQAFKWVWADKNTPEGWRPLTWQDLHTALPGVSLPTLPLHELQRAHALGDVANRVATWASAFPFAPSADAISGSSLSLPADISTLPDNPGQWRVDRIENLVMKNQGVRDFISEKLGAEEVLKFDDLFEKLEARAAEPSMSRTMRMLIIPNEVRLSYRGLKTSVDMNLRQEADNEYVGTLTDLKESIDFRVKGEDYVTPSRHITLVPSPQIIEGGLKRTEHQPAYLYHRPILDETGNPSPLKLKGLKQVVKDRIISLTGDRSRFEIPAGTDVFLSATVDKDLAKAWLVCKPGKYAGIDPSGAEVRIELPIQPDHRTVTPQFTAADGNPITRATEFELEFLDTDGVTNRRIIQIQPNEDRGPEVNVKVDVIRKVGATYLCTPKARIPFDPQSNVTDLNADQRTGGLNALEYHYSYTQMESFSDVSSKAAIIGLFFHNTPTLPSVAPALYRAGMIAGFGPSLRSARPTVEQSVMLETFKERYARGGFLTEKALLPKLQQEPPSLNDLPMITSFEFGADRELGFDIQEVLPGLLQKDASKIQPHYMLTLSVVATDSNVETGPKVATNKEPLVFKIVSEAELLSEISREESEIGLKLDEVLTRLSKADQALSDILTRVGTAQKGEFDPYQTRSIQVAEAVSKAKDITITIATDYARILAEYRANRFTDNLTTQLSSKIVNPLDLSLRQDFPNWEEAHNALAAKLNAEVQPEPDLLANARLRMNELRARLRAIREEIGQILGIQQLITQAQRIQQELTQTIGPGLGRLIENAQASLLAPNIVPPPLVTVSPGQKATVKVDLIWLVPMPDREYSLQLVSPAESGLKHPDRIAVKDQTPTVPIEITGGKSGEWTIQVIPSIGKPEMIKISVK